MAKQTFTTGQVLTAAQMTSLQQTAMGGGSTTAKTTSYVLVAADAGTTVAMDAAGSTTITVNTSLFSEGDTVTIQNRGAGVCTITAGTATVTTSGSLVLAQYQGGVLYFNSASSATFYQFATPASGDIEGVTAGTGISGGGTSGTVTITNSMATAIDAKGDLIVGTGADTFSRLAVGTNGHTLVADSSTSTGLKWAAPAGGSGFTLIQRSTFSDVGNTGSTFDNVFSGTYNSYLVIIESVYAGTSTDDFEFRLRYGAGSTQTAQYLGSTWKLTSGGTGSWIDNYDEPVFKLGDETGSSDGFLASGQIFFNHVGNTSERATWRGQFYSATNAINYYFAGGQYNAETYTGIQFKSSSSNITGAVAVYGMAKS
jgi:hypothetical protein